MATKKIPLNGKYGKGKFVLVDEEDFTELSKYKWYGRLHKGKYLYAARDLATIRMHRVITDAPKGMVVDHINHDTLDNRKTNLRVCTNAENSRNSHVKKTVSGYKGVYPVTRSNSWQAVVTVGYKRVYLGIFGTREEAAIAYNKSALEHHGRFAHLNTIPSGIGG